ncbi:MAG: FUSC family protein [Alphaproteobacteria bacterium]
MKPFSSEGVLYALRTFAAAMLALYISYQLDLPRPTWAFITAYIVSLPLFRGGARAKALYRICGTLCGATVSIATIPNLVDTPELLVLVLAWWVGICLYFSISDGTPRAYGFMLAGYTTAIIGFPSVDAPQLMFDTALSRTEEICVGILCVELMSYLPGSPRASDTLFVKIEAYLLDMRKLALDLLSFSPQTVSILDRAKMMMEIEAIDALRIQAHYDTPRFKEIEGWVVQLQRHLRDFFADLLAFDAQLKQANDHIKKALRPITAMIVKWIESGATAVPDELQKALLAQNPTSSQRELIKSGILDSLKNVVARRYECLTLKEKICVRERMTESYETVAHYTDYKQAGIYAFAAALMLIIGCTFWIATAWPEGGIAAEVATIICCFLASLEMPSMIVVAVLAATTLGSMISWSYNFALFPHIDGFPLLVFIMGLSCIPIGIAMANPKLTNLMFGVILGVNLVDLHNRFTADAAAFLNGYTAQTVGIVAAGATLAFVRAFSLKSATERLLIENRQALADLAQENSTSQDAVLDRMVHRSALALIRAPQLRQESEAITSRVLLDLRIQRVLIQIRNLMPAFSADTQAAMNSIRHRLALFFSTNEEASHIHEEIRALKRKLDHSEQTRDAMQLEGLIETLNRGIKEMAA